MSLPDDAGSTGRTDAGSGADGAGRMDNGLHAARYVPLTDIDSGMGQQLLMALSRARIPAFLGAAPTEEGLVRLFVDSDERIDARTIVTAAVRALGQNPPPLPESDELQIDTDSVFDSLVAGWHVDTVAAVREAERDLSREDADWRSRLHKPQARDEVWLDEDHYVPPPPPPLPRLAGPTIIAIIVVVLSITVLAFGAALGMTYELTLVLGIGGLVLSAGILFSRLRDHQRDEDDDGSAV